MPAKCRRCWKGRGMPEIRIDTIYGAKSREPIVRLVLIGRTPALDDIGELQGGERAVEIQISPEEALRQAKALIEAATAAYTDAFIFQFCNDHLGLREAATVGMLKGLRDYREARLAADAKEQKGQSDI